MSAIGIWLVLDLVLVLQTRRDAFRPVIAIQPVVLVLVAVALLAGESVSSSALWALLGLVNIALAGAGLRRQRALASMGLLATVAAITLVILHSFASLPVISVAAILSLAAALFPSRHVVPA